MENKNISNTSSGSDSKAAVISFCVISAAMIFLVYTKNIVFGSKAGNWNYPYFDTIRPIPVWIPLAVLFLLGILILAGSKLIHSHERITLAGCFVIAFVLQSLIHRVYPYSMGRIIESDLANSFYTPAMRYSPAEILSQFLQLAPSLPLHAGSNMPGKILFFQGLRLITSSPRWMGYLIILFSTLGAPLLYGICKQLFHERLTALYAFILYAIIPGKLYFFPVLNTITPVSILVCLYLFLAYIEKKQSVYLWLSGAAFYLLILFEPAPLATGLVFAGILYSGSAEKKVSKKEVFNAVIFPILAFLSVYLVFRAILSFDLLRAFEYVLKDATQFNIRDHREYWIWLGENPKEFFYAAGLPVVMIFIYLISQAISRWKRALDGLRNGQREINILVSLLATLCVVVLLGVNRGEITRLWIYLQVLFQIPAALFLAKIEKGQGFFFLVASTLAAQSLITLQRVGFIIP